MRRLWLGRAGSGGRGVSGNRLRSHRQRRALIQVRTYTGITATAAATPTAPWIHHGCGPISAKTTMIASATVTNAMTPAAIWTRVDHADRAADSAFQSVTKSSSSVCVYAAPVVATRSWCDAQAGPRPSTIFSVPLRGEHELLRAPIGPPVVRRERGRPQRVGAPGRQGLDQPAVRTDGGERGVAGTPTTTPAGRRLSPSGAANTCPGCSAQCANSSARSPYDGASLRTSSMLSAASAHPPRSSKPKASSSARIPDCGSDAPSGHGTGT